MLPDLFDQDPEPDEQDRYRDMLQASLDESLAIIRARGEIPPWVESDTLLNKDELRVLKLIDESGQGYLEGEQVVVDYGVDAMGMPITRLVSRLTRDAGFNAEANGTAVVNGCIAKGYIERVYEGSKSRLMLLDEGRWRLDVIEADEYWETDR